MNSGVVNPYAKRKASSNILRLQRRPNCHLNNAEGNTHNSEIAFHSVHAISLCESSCRGPQFLQQRGAKCHDNVLRML
jgi:hypothetical protein